MDEIEKFPAKHYAQSRIKNLRTDDPGHREKRE